VSPPGLFASLFYAVLDLHTGTLDYVNAGHHYPFVLRSEGGSVELVDGGTVLGLTEEACFAGRLKLGGSDVLVLYSDGITDRSNPEGEMYGLERLEQAALRSRTDPARICLYSILGDIQGWSGGTPAEDDATLIVVRIR
jgi:sigma-B regulation protein RsbU (phosphoserine phosphatase)